MIKQMTALGSLEQNREDDLIVWKCLLYLWIKRTIIVKLQYTVGMIGGGGIPTTYGDIKIKF